GVALYGVEVGGAARPVTKAQALVAGDRPGGGRAAPAAGAASGDLVEDLGVLVAGPLVVAVDLPEGQLSDAVGGREALQRLGVGGGELTAVVVGAGDRG